jgi:uncharacterized membrane protein YoaK (UPF0700 family)
MLLLCFIMGLQNATMTRISGARIRTIHMTGLITDAGIEGKKRVDWNRDITRPAMSWVCAAHPKLRLQSILLASFFAGGVFGASGFNAGALSRAFFSGCFRRCKSSPHWARPDQSPSDDEGAVM